MAKIMDILLLLLIAGATSATKFKCHELRGTVALTNDAGFCEVVTNAQGTILGNSGGMRVTLDFSKADETTLNTFLAKFDKIYGAVIMDGNEHVTNLNLKGIQFIDGKTIPSDDMFILIRNNPKLANIVWSENLAMGAAQSSHVLVYNNPLLDANSLKKLDDAVTSFSSLKSYTQKTELNECQFEYPLKMATPDPSKYIAPSAEFLKNCKKIKGDFIVENAKLVGLGPFELGADACLRLVNVDMKDVKITAAANTGSGTCKDGTKSEIAGNPNLCGDELETLHKYYKDPAAVAVKVDPDTCTMPCSSGQQSSLYILCNSTLTTPPRSMPRPTTTTAPSNIATAADEERRKPHSPITVPPEKSSLPARIVGGLVAGILVVLTIVLVVLWRINHLPFLSRPDDAGDYYIEEKKNVPASSPRLVSEQRY